MAEPRISVVISNYNYAQFLKDALDSVFAQTNAPAEVIVVDDGSTDESSSVISRYDVRAIYQENRGQAAALDAGVGAASGDVICLMDADDVWLPAKLERVAAVFRARPEIRWLRHKLEIVEAGLERTGATTPVFTGSGVMSPSATRAAERVVTVSTSAIALSRSVREDVLPLHSPELRYDADAILVARLASRYAGWQEDAVLGWYRRHERQQFAGKQSLHRMLSRQIEVGALIARELRRGEPVCNYKHRAILAALDQRARSGEVLRGMRACLRLAGEPSLALRQTASLLFAGIAPHAWVRSLNRKHGVG